jgi:Di-haem oxidoreductase, putative peroxidase
MKYPGFPEIAGRVSRLKDKRIGRFGWKSQTASLSDFVLTACAVELGLEVPAHHQGGSPQHPDAKSTGLDLDAQECESLVAYVSDLPRPAERKPESAREANEVEAGRGLFAKVGCASCHSPKLGKVENIYSDLLLHDLGPALGDVGQYGVFDPSSSEEEVVDDPATVADASGISPVLLPGQSFVEFPVPTSASGAAGVVPAPPLPPATVTIVAPAVPPPTDTPRTVSVEAPPAAPPVAPVFVSTPAFQGTVTAGMVQFGTPPTVIKRPTSGPASRFEWRTPPLWGFRDSAPYLHDGRAKTLDQAIAFHGGEAGNVTQRFFKLTAKERQQLEAFMKALTAPAPAELVASTK